jgi:hypothetical protein
VDPKLNSLSTESYDGLLREAREPRPTGASGSNILHPIGEGQSFSRLPTSWDPQALHLIIIGEDSNDIKYWKRDKKGTIQSYLWRTVNLLASMSREYVRWPTAELRRQQRAQQLDDVFVNQVVSANCVGCLDGSEIPLRERPLKDPEVYFSRKKVYGFNLQAICQTATRKANSSMPKRGAQPVPMIPLLSKLLHFINDDRS